MIDLIITSCASQHHPDQREEQQTRKRTAALSGGAHSVHCGWNVDSGRWGTAQIQGLLDGPQAHTQTSFTSKIIPSILERNITLNVLFIRWFISVTLKIQLLSVSSRINFKIGPVNSTETINCIYVLVEWLLFESPMLSISMRPATHHSNRRIRLNSLIFTWVFWLQLQWGWHLWAFGITVKSSCFAWR